MINPQKLGVAIVGGGSGISGAHLEAYRTLGRSRLVAVCDKNVELGSKVAKEHRATFFPDYDQMLDSPGIDMVDICSPDFCHGEHAVKAAAKNGFFLCFTNFGGEEVMAEDVTLAQIKRGYLKQILLSNDFAYFVRKNRLEPHFPVPCDHLSKKVLAKLVRLGVKASQIETIMTENARRSIAF
ncbi:MAG: Gfo/Idh/MocA family oxidoreductase [Verrucomicrobiae bacterium]|nr:Gfo/Idh/MocA family oxidoreductase [Verrucomicrobiae bacterium]